MANKQQVNIIVAVGNFVPGKGYAIGKNGEIPWKHEADMKWFRETTMGHVVIMGMKTFQSMNSHPLKWRINIVVTSRFKWAEEEKMETPYEKFLVDFKTLEGVYYVPSLERAIEFAQTLAKDDIFIIGGASIYKQALDSGLVDNIYMDFLAEKVEDADSFFPAVDALSKEWETQGHPIEVEKGTAYATIFSKITGQDNEVDEQYLNLLRKITTEGQKKETRAGTTYSIFGTQMRFDLGKGLPMLTTKKMFSKGVIHELLWFIKDSTNIKYLVDNNVHIWDDDAYRYFLERFGDMYDNVSKERFIEYVKMDMTIVGTDYTYGDLGPVYGKQWTDWNGHNQIHEVINTLRTNPDDRRMIISAWNVGELDDMALPPCHYSCQFYTTKMSHEERTAWAKANLKLNPIAYFVDFSDEDLDKHNVPTRKLSCLWNQRSVDVPLGLPFNILSYALLTHLIAQCVDMVPGELIFNGGDTHVYENQMEGVKEQLERNPHRFRLPKLSLNPDIKSINVFTYDDIHIENYQSYPAIKFPLSVGL